jgi:hypothetical protein
MPFSAGPPILYEGKLLGYFDDEYYDDVIKVYKERQLLIYHQFDQYIKEIENPDFKRLHKLPVELT